MHGRWRLALLAALMAAAAFHLRNNFEFWRGGDVLPAPGRSQADAEVAAVPPPLQVVQTTVAPPLDVTVADTSGLAIARGAYAAFPFDGKGRSECRVRGGVQVVPGGRRVSVLVADRAGMADLEAGRSPATYYDSGPVSAVTLDLRLDGRTFYTLVVKHDGAGAAARTVVLRQVVAACTD